MTKSNKSKKLNRMSCKAYLVFCLLLVYCFQCVSVEFLHELVHHHHETETAHTQELENDLCHRTIYHGEKNESCGHKSHLTKSTTCSFTDPCIISKHLAPARFFAFFHTTLSYFDFQHTVFAVVEKLAHLPSRAPPVFSIIT